LVPGIPREDPDPKAKTQALIEGIGKIPTDQYKLGLTKVFFKTGQVCIISTQTKETHTNEAIISLR